MSKPLLGVDSLLLTPLSPSFPSNLPPFLSLLPPAPHLPASAPPNLRIIVFSNPSCPHGSDMGFWCSHNSASPSPALSPALLLIPPQLAQASTLSPPTARPKTSPPAMPARTAADGQTDSHPFVTFSSQPRSRQASSRQKYPVLVKLLGNSDHPQPPSLLAHKTIMPSNGFMGEEGAQART